MEVNVEIPRFVHTDSAVLSAYAQAAAISFPRQLIEAERRISVSNSSLEASEKHHMDQQCGNDSSCRPRQSHEVAKTEPTSTRQVLQNESSSSLTHHQRPHSITFLDTSLHPQFLVCQNGIIWEHLSHLPLPYITSSFFIHIDGNSNRNFAYAGDYELSRTFSIALNDWLNSPEPVRVKYCNALLHSPHGISMLSAFHCNYGQKWTHAADLPVLAATHQRDALLDLLNRGTLQVEYRQVLFIRYDWLYWSKLIHTSKNISNSEKLRLLSIPHLTTTPDQHPGTRTRKSRKWRSRGKAVVRQVLDKVTQFRPLCTSAADKMDIENENDAVTDLARRTSTSSHLSSVTSASSNESFHSALSELDVSLPPSSSSLEQSMTSSKTSLSVDLVQNKVHFEGHL